MNMTDPTEPTRGSATVVEPSLAGIRGWLVLPAIGLVLSLILELVGLLSALMLLPNAQDAGYGGVYIVELLVGAGLLVFTLYAAILFFNRDTHAPSILIALMITNIVASGLLLWVELGAGAEELMAESAKGLVRSSIGAAIWVPYFVVSRRVKATFVK